MVQKQSALTTECVVITMLLCVAVAGCVTATPPKPVTRVEIAQRDNKLGTELSPRFEAGLKFKQDAEVAVYLRSLAQKLVDASPDLRGSNVGVFMLEDRGRAWKDYGLPGLRVYLSSGLIRGFDYENELAAALAVELGHLSRRDLLQRIHQDAQTDGNARKADYSSVDGLTPYDAADLPTSIDYFGPAGVFVFPEGAHLGAVDTAVDLLYHAGFDPRGLANLWKRYQDHPKESPFEPELLAKLMDRTRQDIAKYAPLRNPIVRSASFLSVQKRIKRL